MIGLFISKKTINVQIKKELIMFKRKVTKITTLALSLLMMGSVSAFALSYSFSFTPPYVGSAKYTPAAVADGLAAYVDPSGTTSPTTYVLTQPSPTSTAVVSNTKTGVTSAKTYFTYLSGYGGTGQSYKMNGYPSNTDFQTYFAAGAWKP
jgi:hypothetical protein